MKCYMVVMLGSAGWSMGPGYLRCPPLSLGLPGLVTGRKWTGDVGGWSVVVVQLELIRTVWGQACDWNALWGLDVARSSADTEASVS